MMCAVFLPVRSCMIAAALVAAIYCLPRSVSGQGPQPASDVVCQTLMDDYILRGIKVSSDTIEAASELIAVRGRDNGYWKVVYEYYKEAGNDNAGYSPAGKLLRILTKMLKRDGQARWRRTHPDPNSASAFGDVLPPDVLDTIMARANQERGRNLANHVLAVVAAHDPRSRDFLRAIMNSEPPPQYGTFGDLFDDGKNSSTPPAPAPPPAAGNTDARYLAAVGLAELGDEAGIEWLVTDPAHLAPYIFYDHVDGRGNALGNLILALADLTGENFGTIEEWRAWWAAKKREQPRSVFRPVGRVRLRYP